MPVRVQVAEYYYAVVEDKPGEARRLLGFCSAHGVDLMNITTFPVGKGRAQIDLFPKDAGKLKKAADEAAIGLVGPKKAFLLQGADRPGVLVDYLLRLAYAGVNIYACNGTADGRGGFGFVLWVRPEDFEKASKALGI
jgi:hypothetical protein